MLDLIVIGREGFKSTDKPHVIYCGDSRSEAKAAVADTGNRFAWVYEVNGMITRNYRTQRSAKVTAPVDTAATDQAPETPKKKSKSK
jgi:hypothetical protein